MRATSSSIASSSSGRGEITTPSSASVRLSAGIDPGTRPPTSAWWARLAAKPSSSPSAREHGRDDGDVGQVGAARERVVEDPGDARRVALAEHRGTAAGIAPRCTGMCSACITICPSGSNRAVEASRRSLMFEECAERISTTPISSQAARRAPVSDLQLDRVEHGSASAPAPQADRARARPPSPRQPGGTSSVASGSAHSAGPASAAARRRLAADDARLERRRRRTRAAPPHSAAGSRASACGRSAGARAPHRDAHVDELDLRRVVAVAVALLVRARERRRAARQRRAVALGGGAHLLVHGELERLAAVAQLVAGARLAPGVAQRRGGVGEELAALAREALVRQRGARSASRVRATSRRGAAAASPSAQSTPEARGQRMREIPSSLGERGGVQRPGAAEGHQREAPRVDAPLDGHHPQRAEHLGLGDAHDPLCAGERVETQLCGEDARSPARRRRGRARRRRRAASRRAGARAARFASVTVGSSPPRP